MVLSICTAFRRTPGEAFGEHGFHSHMVGLHAETLRDSNAKGWHRTDPRFDFRLLFV